jgi:XTP/dITP diphosphohydrolase
MKLRFATANEGKLLEVRKRLEPLGFEVERLDDPYPELQTGTLEQVVEWGLDWLWQRHNVPLVIDDSGLFIHSYKGFPGVYSAYVFKTLGCEGVLKLMEGVEDRNAEFRCCVGYMDEGGSKLVVTGTARGRIIYDMRGTQGFGYDPIFVPEGESRTFAEMGAEEKNTLSHRGKAFGLLAEELERLLG